MGLVTSYRRQLRQQFRAAEVARVRDESAKPRRPRRPRRGVSPTPR
jgi:hypothetical protein